MCLVLICVVKVLIDSWISLPSLEENLFTSLIVVVFFKTKKEEKNKQRSFCMDVVLMENGLYLSNILFPLVLMYLFIFHLVSIRFKFILYAILMSSFSLKYWILFNKASCVRLMPISFWLCWEIAIDHSLAMIVSLCHFCSNVLEILQMSCLSWSCSFSLFSCISTLFGWLEFDFWIKGCSLNSFAFFMSIVESTMPSNVCVVCS